MSAIVERLRAGLVSRSREETQQAAAALAHVLPVDTTLALHGDLGAGKTTFVQGLARGLGIQEGVTSPTFTLFNLYTTGSRRLLHFDAYRLERPEEADALMIEDFLISPWCLAVEWPEKVAAWLPANAWHLDLALRSDESHTLRLRA